MTASSINYADTYRGVYLKGPSRGIFDSFFRTHARRRGPRFDQMRSVNTLAYSTIGQLLQGEMAIYRFGGISKGMRGHYLVKQNGPFTIERFDGSLKQGFHLFDLDENVGSQLFHGSQLEGLSQLRNLHPNTPVIVPGFLQAATFLAGQSNFDRGTKRKDKDYMILWEPVIIDFINMLHMQGDWPFSAMSNVEAGIALRIAAGLEPRRPNADMEFRDQYNGHVSLYDIARKRFEYIVWAAENNFDLHVEPTMLARDFAIGMLAAQGKLPNANPEFLAGIARDADKLKQLQALAEPLLLERVKADKFEIDLLDLQSVNPDFVAAYADAKKGVLHTTHALLATIGSELGIRHFTDEQLRAGAYPEDPPPEGMQGDFGGPSALLLPMRDSDMQGKLLGEHDGHSIFSRNILQDLTDREVMQAQFVLGVAETFMLPAKRAIFMVADDKYGSETERLGLSAKLAYGDEAPNVKGVDFDRDIRVPHRAAFQQTQAALKAHGHSISSGDFQRFYGLFQEMPEFAVAPGEAMPGSAARLIARHAYLARNITDFCLKTGSWEQSNDGVQDMILATRMQLGLEASTQTNPHVIRVYDETGKPLSLANRATAIWPQLKKAMEMGRDAKDLVEPATALAQLWAFHRLINDHPMRQHVFAQLGEDGVFMPKHSIWHQLPAQLSAYDSLPFEKLWRDEIKPVLDGKLSLAVRLRHLEGIEDFAEIRRRQIATQKIDMAGTRPDDTRMLKRGGVTRVSEATRNAM